MAIPDLDWQRPGLLTRGQTKAKYGHWAVPGWAPAPDGGMYWILPDDMSTYNRGATTDRPIEAHLAGVGAVHRRSPPVSWSRG